MSLSRPSKQFTMIVLDIAAYLLCAVATGWLLQSERLTFPEIYLIGLTTILVTIPLGWVLGLYETIVRYIGTEFLVRANFTAATAAALVSGLSFVAGLQSAPYRVGVMLWALLVLYICFSRFATSKFLASSRQQHDPERVLIYGAGSAGAQLAASLQLNREILPVAMIDDDLSLIGKRVKGLKVYDATDLEKLVKDERINRVLLALPRVSRRRRRIILETIEELSIRVQTIPNFDDLVSGIARVDDIRDVSIADLMGRQAVPPNPELLYGSIERKNVLVTGAGGSIGSELCRQIIRLNADRLILLENAEASLYRIERELRDQAENDNLPCEIVALLGSVCDYQRVIDVITAFDIHTIYHAAAYKHVPIVEQNVLEGMKNNSLGTLQLATAACESKVETFVLVSTDKAVRPANTMGATKRVAELVLHAMQEQYPDTRLCMVRFGNVLDSSGSVVPLFREQIRNGGPVTVTHRDIVRYFMTIPEAAELVIQAGSMARGGDIFVLDMGEPIRIQDLAKRMIHLMGMSICNEDNPDGDIEIRYTGLRPAEKLYEELLVGDDVSGTEHPRIMRAVESFEPFSVLLGQMRQLSDAIDSQDCNLAREILFNIVAVGQPSTDLEDLVWDRKASNSSSHEKLLNDNKVTQLLRG